MVKLTKLEQFIAEASDALTFDQIAAQLNRTPRAIEQAYERMERKRKAEAIKREPLEVLNSCAHCYTISAVLKEIERRANEARLSQTNADAMQRAALVEAHEEEIKRQARTIGTLPGLVNWLENAIDERGLDAGFHFTRAQFSSDWNSTLSYLFPSQAPETAPEETEAPRMKCNQCEMLSINGVACHETGCPNMRKTWIDGEWIRFLECRECGCDVREGEACNCNEPIEEEESPATFGEAPTTSPEAPQKSPVDWNKAGPPIAAQLREILADADGGNAETEKTSRWPEAHKLLRKMSLMFAVGLAFAFTSPANASEYRGEVSCACEGICEMSGCDSDNCQCTLPEFGEVNPELESLWLMLGVQDWGDIDEEDFNDPFVCETTDRILQLENMEVIDGEVFPQSKGGAGN